MFSTLPLAAIYLASIVSSSPVLSKRAYSNIQQWTSLDNCLKFGLENIDKQSQMIELEYSRYFKQLADPKKLKYKTWKIPDGPEEFVQLRCMTPGSVDTLDWYLGLTDPQWHIDVKSSVVDEILSSATLDTDSILDTTSATLDTTSPNLDETAMLIPKNKPQGMSIVDQKLHNARQKMLQRQQHPQKLLERFMSTPASSFYPQSIFDKEAFFRGPATNKKHLLPPPGYDGSTDLTIRRTRAWLEKTRKGIDYYGLMEKRLAAYEKKVQALKLREAELDNEDKNLLHCYEDKMWLYTQKKKAYERLWLGTTRGSSVNHAKHLLNADKKKDETIKILDKAEHRMLRSEGANRVIDIPLTQNDREPI